MTSVTGMCVIPNLLHDRTKQAMQDLTRSLSFSMLTAIVGTVTMVIGLVMKTVV